MHRARLQLFVALLAVGLLTTVMWRLGTGWLISQRDRVVARLTTQLRSQDQDRAVAAIDGLVRLDDAGIEPLVGEALGTRPRIAPAARWALDDTLQRWQRQFRQDRKAQKLALHLDRLSAAMVDQLPASSPEPLLWARQLAERILELTAELPPGSRLDVVEHCSSVLHFTTALANAAPPADQPTSLEESEPLTPDDPKARSMLPARQQSAADVTAREHGGSPHPHSLLFRSHEDRAAGDSAMATPLNARVGSVRARFADPRDESPIRSGNSAVSWQPDRENGKTARAPDQVSEIAGPGQAHREVTSDEPLPRRASSLQAEATSEQLLTRLANASSGEVERVQQQLAGRGWGKVPAELARMLVSSSAADRLCAIDALRSTTGVNPRPPLMMLAKDPDANVRLAVVTLLATSRDPELIEQAWQTAIRDEDPRVARLADWLQANRRQ